MSEPKLSQAREDILALYGMHDKTHERLKEISETLVGLTLQQGKLEDRSDEATKRRRLLFSCMGLLLG